METNDSLSERVTTLYDRFGAWRRVGQEIAVAAQMRRVIDNVDGHPERYSSLANALHRGHIDDSPTLREALGLPPRYVKVPPEMVRKRKPKPREDTRTRIAADVTEAQRAALHRMAEAEGLTWSAFCRRLAEMYMEVEG